MGERPDDLTGIVARRLAADTLLGDAAGALILAALPSATPDPARDAAPDPAPDPVTSMATGQPAAAGVYLSGVSVEGFRGIGPERTLPVPAGPGLTVVCGRNGSGKSSFAEAAEIVLTGENSRWGEGRSKEWKDGWRNLHHPSATRIRLDGIAEGSRPGTFTVERHWPAGARLEDGAAHVVRPGRSPEPVGALPWHAALATHRPFLTYSDLGRVLSGRPSDLYDALWSLLGLDALVAAQNRLADARRDITARQDAVQAGAVRLQSVCAAADDVRAATAARLLAARPWDLEQLSALASGASGPGDTSGASAPADAALHRLRALAALAPPSPQAVAEAVARLRAAASRRAALASTSADRASRVADLLDRALSHHHSDGDQLCPVCGGAVLDARWRAEAQARARELREQAGAADDADRAVRDAVTHATRLVPPPPEVLPSGLLARWQDLARCPDDPLVLAAHLETHAGPVHAQAAAVAAQAAAELRRREDQWLPLAAELSAWLDAARAAAEQAGSGRELDRAIRWLKAAAGEIANDRLHPLAEQSAVIWERLRQESNVSLGPVTLRGTATRRHVALDVTVDGSGASALGVMSQGELHALALSLFLPRATLPDSPFRFLVIDDPVQALDPAKVDGLADVLVMVAQRHQVVVFTHDDRLPSAIRQLGLPATILEVTRHHNSVVHVVAAHDPCRRPLQDAQALLLDAGIDDEVATHVVPGLCRMALDRACLDLFRRRRLTAGTSLADIEAVLGRASRLRSRLALVFFDDHRRAKDVAGRLRGMGRWAEDTVRLCNEGAHGPIPKASLSTLISNTERLIEQLDR